MADVSLEINDKEVDNCNNLPKNVEELTEFIRIMLDQFQEKCQTMSDQILSKIDEMGNRIDDLEKNISDLMTQTGIEVPEK